MAAPQNELGIGREQRVNPWASAEKFLTSHGIPPPDANKMITSLQQVGWGVRNYGDAALFQKLPGVAVQVTEGQDGRFTARVAVEGRTLQETEEM